MKKVNNFEQLASILRPEQFQYKGDAAIRAEIKAKANKNQSVNALKASIERGKGLTK